jgi:3' exoribonuclease, RNase T-like
VRHFLDCEFLDDGERIDLISIGLVAEDGRELYACNLDAQLHRCHTTPWHVRDGWMRDNVLAKLPSYGNKAWAHRDEIKERVLDFMLAPRVPGHDFKTFDGKKIELWGYYSAYDFVAFCQLIGPRMIDMIPLLPKFCRDLKQLSVDVGSPEHPAKPPGAHNALEDARWNKQLYEFLMAQRVLMLPRIGVGQ